VLLDWVKTRLKRWPTLLATARFTWKSRLRKPERIIEFWRIVRLEGSEQHDAALVRLRRMIEDESDIPPVASELAYRTYDSVLRQSSSQIAIFPEFEKFGLYQAVMPKTLLDALMTEVNSAPSGPIEANDYDPRYFSNPYIEVSQGTNYFVRFDGTQRRRLTEIMIALQPPVERCLGVPGRIVNIKSWWTNSHASPTQMNAWHLDGFPEQICKLMIYPFGADAERGTTEFRYDDGSARLITGPPGVYAIFKNSSIMHRGIAPTSGRRIVVELTIAPAPAMDLRIANGGANATFPKIPWAELPL
jgi:hypothetical protein